jgi:hypothetical protein
MDWLRVLGFTFVIGAVGAGCAPGRDVKSAGKEDKLGFDESGKGKKCETPSSSCEEVKEQSLDFQEKCREAGFRMKQCGCESLCSGNINGTKQGYNSKNQLKVCTETSSNCQEQETSAAYQDGCDSVGGEMFECGCDWLCSKQLKAAIPDAPKEDEKSADDASGGDASGDAKKGDSAKKDDKPHGNMDGKAPPPPRPSNDNASHDKPSKKSNDKASGKKSNASDKSDDEPKHKGRFHDIDE